MQRKRILYLLSILALLAAMLPVGVTAQGEAPVAPGAPLQIEVLQPQLDETEGGKPATMSILPESMAAPDGMNLFSEIEPNGTAATATTLPSNDIVAVGNVFPNGDLDYFSFSGSAGDRVYAATMTSFSASGSVDSYLTLFGTDGTTVIEFDNDDGSFGTTSSSIAGATLPSAGTYYLQVRHNSATGQLRPYRLHLRVQSGSPVAETEPNDTQPTANPLPPSGWVSGATSSAADVDLYSLTLNAGDSVFLSLDLDPERDTTEWNAQLGLGVFNNFVLVVNDAGAAGADSEAFFMTVKDAGTYYVLVSAPTGGTTFGTYNLSASVLPKQQLANCTTYTSTDVPVVIPTGPGMAQSTLTVPGNPRIGDIDVSIVLTHTFMQDLDVHLVSPAGNDNGLFSDVGNSTVGSANIQMNTTLDDEAALPIGQFQVVAGPSFTPELNYRLSWYDYTDAGGVWTLKLYDDATGDGGVLESWSITICEPPPPPTCPIGYDPVTVYSSDFEAGDDGFTHSGVQDEWERGLPTFTPLTTCNSGVNCWVTDLDNTYNASSNQNLLSPAIDLSGYSGPVILRWAQRYHIESATFDGAYAQVQEVGGANPTRLWTWLDATMNNTVGSTPSTTIAQSAGWGERWADISSYAGQSIEALFNLSSDTTVQLAGLGIDDVSVTACEAAPSNPAITLDKTVGTDTTVCATTDEITLPYGGDMVTYCYEVTNTGDVSFNTHDLVDSELGALLNNFPYTLAPGASAFITATTFIGVTTVNTATWDAFNTFDGGGAQASATDAATVTVDLPAPAIVLTKTVGTDPTACAVTDDITVPANTDVTYCYTVENTGNTYFDIHDLDDSELGALLTDFYYELSPGASVFVTETANIAVTTVNTATWNAELIPDEGGNLSAQASDTATVTVEIDPPNIFVDPLSMASSQPPDVQVNQTLTISNTGGGTLDWSIDEEDTTLPPFVTASSAPDLASASEDAGTVAAPGAPEAAPEKVDLWRAPDAVLYDNGPLVNSAGTGVGGANESVLQTSTLLMTTLGFGHQVLNNNWVADDFTVSDAGGWTVDTATFFAYQTGSSTTSTMTNVNWILYDGQPGGGGSVVTSGSGLASTVWANIYRVTQTTTGVATDRPIMATTVNMGSLALPAGTYWLAWQTAGTLGSGPWAPPVTINGQATTGNGLQSLGGTAAWAPANDGGSLTQQGFPFILEGTVGGGEPCVTLSNISWLSLVPTAGSNAGGTDTDVTVTFDSTGLVPGVYTGNLCVESNDPDAGPGNETDLVIVPVTLTVQAPTAVTLSGLDATGEMAPAQAPLPLAACRWRLCRLWWLWR